MSKESIKYGDNVYFTMDESPTVRKRPHKNYSMTLNDDFVGHDVQLEHPRDGISVSLNNFCFENDTVFPYQVGEGAVTFTTVLSGHLENSMDMRRGGKVDGVCKPCDMVLFTDNCEGMINIKGGVAMRTVAVYVSKDLLLEMTEGDKRFTGLSKALRIRNGLYQLGAFNPSPETQLIATQLLSCPLKGACRRLYVESKTLELISAALDKIGSDARPGHFPLSKSDVERIREARRLLLEDITNPPRIRQLAKSVGINEFKIKYGFREVFGCTIRQCLRMHRMETARSMLADTDTTVGTVASMVGYTNMSHFITAFRDQFGVTPGALLSHKRRHLTS